MKLWKVRRLLCSLRGHREHHRTIDPPITAQTLEGPWTCNAVIRCWCGTRRLYEGMQQVPADAVHVFDPEPISDLLGDLETLRSKQRARPPGG